MSTEPRRGLTFDKRSRIANVFEDNLGGKLGVESIAVGIDEELIIDPPTILVELGITYFIGVRGKFTLFPIEVVIGDIT